MKATFDIESREGKIKAFNAKNSTSISLKNLENGERVECNGILQYQQTINSYGADQEVTVTVLFGTDGNTYAGVSDTVSEAADNLIDLLKELGEEVFTIEVIKSKSGKGNEFLSIRLA